MYDSLPNWNVSTAQKLCQCSDCHQQHLQLIQKLETGSLLGTVVPIGARRRGSSLPGRDHMLQQIPLEGRPKREVDKKHAYTYLAASSNLGQTVVDIGIWNRRRRDQFVSYIQSTF